MFDRDMLNDLAKLKVNRKRKVQDLETQLINESKLKKIENNLLPTSDEDFEEIVYEDESFEEQSNELKNLLEAHENQQETTPKSSLQNLADFMTGKNKNEPKDELDEVLEEYEDDEEYEEYEEEPTNQQQPIEYKNVDGTQINSKYVGADGNINVIYGEPGKNVVNRKSVQEQRLDNKMSSLADLLTKFKSEEELIAEQNDENVILMDKEVNINKNLKNIDTVVQISNDVEIKVELVLKAFKILRDKIETLIQMNGINIDITRPDYLRALFLKRSLDDMDVARIFTLSLFLQNPEKFPTEDTYEQVIYLNSQVGAKCKSIDLKRMITYISSESEFNQTVDLVVNITKNTNFNADGVSEVFSIKCREALKILMKKYLKNDSLDYMSKINVLSIKQELSMKNRNINSSNSMLDTLNTKLKALHPTLKEQIKRTEDQINEMREKLENNIKEFNTSLNEITLLILLENSRKSGGYNKNFMKNIPVEKISRELKEFEIDAEEYIIKEIITSPIQDEILNNIIKG